MKFIKSTFDIALNDKHDWKLKRVKGYLDETGMYGFHKNPNNQWVLTDIQSGNLISYHGTRRECAEDIERYSEKVNIFRSMDTYKDRVRTFKRNQEENRYEEN